MFAIKGLRYRQLLNIREVEFSTPLTCIDGPSGAGKSTLLRILNRLLEPDEGEVLYHGTSIYNMNPVTLRRTVVMLGQTPVLYGGTLRDELQVGRRAAGLPEVEEDALREVLRQVGLDKDLDHSCETFSGGERQRVCLGRVLLTEAKTILMDEPTAALDQEGERELFLPLFERFLSEKRELVLVTHSMQLLQLFPGEIFRMKDGIIGGEKDGDSGS